MTENHTKLNTFLRQYLLPVALLIVGLANTTLRADDFGRTSLTGNWLDANWADLLGNPGSPTLADNVSIGAENLGSGWLGDVSVDIDSIVDVGNIFLGNGTTGGNLNVLSSGSLSTGTLSIYQGLLQVNNGGSFSSGSLLVSGPNSTANLEGSTTLSNLTIDFGATVTLGSSMNLGNLTLNDGTLNVNANLEAGFVFAGPGLINQSADIKAVSLNLGFFGAGANLNRVSGHLDLDDLNLYNGTSVTLGLGDVVDGNLLIDATSTLTVDASTSLQGSMNVNGTLNLNANMEMANLGLYDGQTIQRTGASAITTGSLSVNNCNFTLDGVDTVTNVASVFNGTLNVNVDTVLPDGLVLSGNSTANLNGKLTSGAINLFESTLNVAADLDAFSIYTQAGAIVQSANITSNSLNLGFYGGGGVFTRINGHLNLVDLNLYNGTSLTLLAGDDISNFISLNGQSSLMFSQQLGDLVGLDLSALSIDGDSVFEIQFDAQVIGGLDWAIRVGGDQQSLLNDYVINGQLVATGATAWVIYDPSRFGNYTYFGYLTSIPEPSTILPLFLLMAFAMGRRTNGRA